MKVWIRHLDVTKIGGPYSFSAAMTSWLRSQGTAVTADYAERDIDVALAVNIIESDELRAFKRRRVPIVQRVDGVPFNTPGTDFIQQTARLRRCYETADAVVFQSHFAKEMVEQTLGAVGCEHRIIYNGADLDLFLPGERGVKSDTLTLVCAAVWRPHKRLAATIAGFLRFHEREPRSRLVVIGPTDRATEEVVHHPAITYRGALSREETARVLRSADIFLHLAWLDCCPNVVLEAQASGLPVICANGGGSREVVVTESGLVIESDPGDTPPPVADIYDAHVIPDVRREHVAEAITKVTAELETRRGLALAARERLGIGRAAREYLDLFEDFGSGELTRPRKRAFWALARQALWRRISGKPKEGPFADVLILTVRKGFWLEKPMHVFPTVMYSPRRFGRDTSWLNSVPLFIRAVLYITFRRPRIVIIGAAQRLAKWFLYLRHRGFFRRMKLVVHNMTYFWTGLAVYADRIIVFSSVEADYFQKQVDKPGLYQFIPLPAYGDYDLPRRHAQAPYVFSGGGTRRDFAAVIEAVRGLPVHLRIRCHSPEKLNYSGELPENVTVGYRVPLQQFLREMNDALFVVVPLEKTELPHGHTTVAQAMRLGKAVISTRGGCVEDYVTEGATGLLVNPYDPEDCRRAIVDLLDNEEKRARFGRQAADNAKRLYTCDHYVVELSKLCRELSR